MDSAPGSGVVAQEEDGEVVVEQFDDHDENLSGCENMEGLDERPIEARFPFDPIV